MPPDPYKTLGLNRDAAPEQIRTAYRKLAKKHHPDLNPGNATAEELFKAVNSANELLSDPDKRAKFDRGEIDAAGDPTAPEPPRYRRYADAAEGARYRTGPDDDHPFGDIFGDFLNRGGGGEPLRMRGADARYALAVDFLDTVTGATRTLTLPTAARSMCGFRRGLRTGRCCASRARAAPAGTTVRPATR